MASLILNFLKWLVSLLEKSTEKNPVKLEPPPAPPSEEPVKVVEPVWVHIARKQIGVAEFAGPRNNPEILKYFLATRYRPKFEDSWCSAFVNWVMARAGYEGTCSAAARSWINWGYPVQKPFVGAICIFWRESIDSAKGHVGFYMGETEKEILVLGGNQGDKVCIAKYPKARLLGMRKPSVSF